VRQVVETPGEGKEAFAHQKYKPRLLEVDGTQTRLTPVFGKTSLLGHEMELRRFSNLVPMPSTEGDFEEMALLAGQRVGLIREVKPAGDIIREMMAKATAVLARLSQAEWFPT
jgi:hypothetical protein